MLDKTQLLQRYPILAFFDFAHLPSWLQAYSAPLHEMAWHLAGVLPYCAETSTALRKLLEAKDCACRAALGLDESHV